MCSTRDNRGKVDAETRGRGDAEIGTWSAVSASRLDRARRGPCLRVSASCLFIVACLLATLVGCSTEQKVTYEPVNQTPIVGDEAMALRADWPKSVSHYANGTVVAYSPRFPYDTNVGHPTSGAVLLEPTLFVLQVCLLPVELVANPPFQEQGWFGAKMPPSYTMQPPLPPPGGAPVGQVLPYQFLGPQSATPESGLPGAPAAPTGGTQLPAYPAFNLAPAGAAPTPPPGAPGGALGPARY